MNTLNQCDRTMQVFQTFFLFCQVNCPTEFLTKTNLKQKDINNCAKCGLTFVSWVEDFMNWCGKEDDESFDNKLLQRLIEAVQ